MEINYEVYTLNFLELGILLVSKGIEKVYGFSIDRRNIESKEQMLKLLHRMVKRNILISDGEAFTILEPFNEMIEILKQAKQAIIITPSTEELPMRCCYLGEKILVSEISIIQKETMKLCLIEKEQFFDYLDEGYLPVQLDKENDWINPAQGEDENPEKEEFIEFVYKNTSDLLKEEEVELIIDKIDIKTSECCERVLIIEKPLNFQLIATNFYDAISLVYTTTNMREQLKMLLREGEV